METVGIIGIKGKEGKFLEQLFIDFGCNVIGSDIVDGPEINARNIEVVKKSDVVIFSVPPIEIVKVIKSLVEFGRSVQLWMDVASIKTAPVLAMLESRAEVVGLHPMCAPTTRSLRGQTLIVCPERLYRWHEWLDKFLSWTEAKIKRCSPEKHDQIMAIVQGLIHAMQRTMASTIRSLNINVEETLSFASPVYRIALSLIGRILKQDAELYADIQMLNPHMPKVLGQAALELNELVETVVMQKKSEFVDKFILDRDHFGPNVLDDAYGLFEELSQLLADRGSEHQLVLNIRDNRPGLLAAITGIFARAGVNLSSIHSFRTMDGIRFLVGLDCPKNSHMIKDALAQMAERGLIKESVT
ncbi:MAG: prephenate dehydrogenase/arogenate dehydrogenase family protein [bacterium]|nr:prephenate dehydrogenase/arogenate dehydrogenase family protein [bacterium]